MNKSVRKAWLPVMFTAYSAVVAAEEVIVVTATQVEQSIEDVDASIQVIDREAIEKFSGRSLSEVLRHSIGLYVVDAGSSSSVSIRGFEDDHTLILVDGLRRTEKYAGSNLNNISLQNVERIEVVRGPMSALYGSDALGGVINIITRQANENRSQVRVIAGGAKSPYGRETGIINAFHDWAGENSGHSIGIEYKNREPYEADNGTINQEERTFLNYRGHFDLSEESELSLGAEYAEQNDKNAVVSSGRFESEERYQLTASYVHHFDEDKLNLDLGFGQSDATVNRGTGDETTDFKQLEVDLRYAGFAGADHLYNMGVGSRRDDAEISINTRDANRDIFHLFFQDQWFVTDNVSLTFGVRHDDYNDFGSTTHPRLSASWKVDKWKIRGSYGSAFRAPSLLQLYSTFTRSGRGTSVINGNPDLKPEESETLELSVAYELAQGGVELVIYQSDVDQLIEARVDSTSGVCPGLGCTTNYLYRNINEARLQGAELIFSYQLHPDHQLRTSIEYLDAVDRQTDERLTSRARWQSLVSWDASWTLQLASQLRVRYVGDYYDTPSRAVAAYNSDHTIVDLSARYQLTKDIRLLIGVDNLFDSLMPENMEMRGTPHDPGSRYYYAGIDIAF